MLSSFGKIQYSNTRDTSSQSSTNVYSSIVETSHVLLHHLIKVFQNYRHHLSWWNIIDRNFIGLHLSSGSQILVWQGQGHIWKQKDRLYILFHGIQTLIQSQLHINILEMMAIDYNFKCAHNHIVNSTVLVFHRQYNCCFIIQIDTVNRTLKAI